MSEAAVDWYRYAEIAHRSRAICGPVSEASAGALIDLLAVPSGGKVADIGCGKGEMLAGAVERWDAFGIGVEPAPGFVRSARALAEARGLADRIHIHARPVEEVALEARTFDAAICVGSTHAYGGFAEALRALHLLVRPAGTILVGATTGPQGVPDDGVLSALGATPEHFPDLAAAVRHEGMKVMATYDSSDEEWHEFELSLRESVERWAEGHRHDPLAADFLARAEAGWERYERWTKGKLVFRSFVLRTP